MFSHYLNRALVDEPQGWPGLKHILERDDDLRFIGEKYDGQVSFHSNGYDVLRDIYRSNSCAIVPYEVTQRCGDADLVVFRANVIMTEVEWEVNACSAATTLADAAYGSYIFNNADLEIFPTATKSKNGTDIDPVDPLLVQFYDPQAPTGYGYADRYGYDWLECMGHAMRYISDGAISGATSDWYDGLGPYENYALFTGAEIRSPSHSTPPYTQPPKYSYNELWPNMWQKYDLWSSVELQTDGTYLLRIEPREYYFGPSVVANHPEQLDFVQTSDPRAYYGQIKCGSSTYEAGLDTNQSLPFLNLWGFTEESYHIPISCNTSETLDLVSSFIIDSNVIERTLVGGDDDWDEETFMVQYWTDPTYTPTIYAVKGDYIVAGSTPYLYNPDLLNERVLRRLNLLGTVQYIDQGTDGFRAESTDVDTQIDYNAVYSLGNYTDPVTPVQRKFNNDYVAPNFDTSNRWGNGTPQGNPVSLADSRYTAAFQGLYVFDVTLYWAILLNQYNFIGSGKRIALRCLLERYDSSNALVETPLDEQTGFYQDPSGVITTSLLTTPVYLNTDDYVVCKYQFIINEAPVFSPTADPQWDVQIRMLRSSFILTQYIEGSGGEIQAADPLLYYPHLFKYERIIPATEWVNITGSVRSPIACGPGSVALPSYTRRISRTVNTGETEFELISRTDNSFV